MKTYYSSFDWTLNYALNSRLFPDVGLRFESGGLPEDIPDVTYAELLETYEKFYHPSNCLVFIYGRQDMDRTLSMVNDYFSRYEKSESLDVCAVQPYFTEPVYAEDTYG